MAKPKPGKRTSVRRPKLTADEKIFYQLKAAAPLITEDVLQDIEQSFLSVEDRVTRRAALLVLLRPGSELIDKIERDREAAVAFAELMEGVGNYAKHLRQVTGLLHAAEGRLLIALCVREDMQSVVAEAQASGRDEHAPALH